MQNNLNQSNNKKAFSEIQSNFYLKIYDIFSIKHKILTNHINK